MPTAPIALIRRGLFILTSSIDLIERMLVLHHISVNMLDMCSTISTALKQLHSDILGLMKQVMSTTPNPLTMTLAMHSTLFQT